MLQQPKPLAKHGEELLHLMNFWKPKNTPFIYPHLPREFHFSPNSHFLFASRSRSRLIPCPIFFFFTVAASRRPSSSCLTPRLFLVVLCASSFVGFCLALRSGLDVVTAIASLPTYKPSERIRQFNYFAEFIGDDRAQIGRATWNKPVKTVYISDCGELKVTKPSLSPSLP